MLVSPFTSTVPTTSRTLTQQVYVYYLHGCLVVLNSLCAWLCLKVNPKWCFTAFCTRLYTELYSICILRPLFNTFTCSIVNHQISQSCTAMHKIIGMLIKSFSSCSFETSEWGETHLNHCLWCQNGYHGYITGVTADVLGFSHTTVCRVYTE